MFHEDGRLTDDSHEISYLFCLKKNWKDLENVSSAAVVIGTLRVNRYFVIWNTESIFFLVVESSCVQGLFVWCSVYKDTPWWRR